MIEQLLNVGYLEVSAETGNMRFSPGLYRLFGMANTANNIADLSACIHFGERATFNEDLSIIRRKQLPPPRIYRVVSIAGSIRHVSLQFDGVIDDGGNVRLFFGVARDVTNEQIQLNAKRTSDKRIEALLNVLKVDCIWYADAQGQLFEHFAISHLEGIAPPFDPLHSNAIHLDDREAVLPAVKRALSGGKAFSMFLRIRGNDGVERNYLKKGFPVHDSEGEIIEWWGVVVEHGAGEERAVLNRMSAHEAAELVTGGTIRALLGLMDWTHEFVAARSGLSKTTIQRFAVANGRLVGAFRPKSIEAVLNTFSRCGVEYSRAPDGSVAISRPE